MLRYSGGGYGNSLNGTRANQMNWQIDGVDTNDLWHNIPAGQPGRRLWHRRHHPAASDAVGSVLRADAVRPRRRSVTPAAQSTSYPLRSGSNNIHGTALLFQSQRGLWRGRAPSRPVKQKGSQLQHRLLLLGGPFIKDKLFGFLTFEHQRFTIGQSGTSNRALSRMAGQGYNLFSPRPTLPVNPLMVKVLDSLWGTSVLAQDTVGVTNNFLSRPTLSSGYSFGTVSPKSTTPSPPRTTSALTGSSVRETRSLPSARSCSPTMK